MALSCIWRQRAFLCWKISIASDLRIKRRRERRRSKDLLRSVLVEPFLQAVAIKASKEETGRLTPKAFAKHFNMKAFHIIFIHFHSFSFIFIHFHSFSFIFIPFPEMICLSFMGEGTKARAKEGSIVSARRSHLILSYRPQSSSVWSCPWKIMCIRNV